MADYPAFPVWTDAYLSDTHPDLTLEEHGCYFLLLLAAWRRPRCALPDDDRWFCRWLGLHGNRWRRLRRSVLERFFDRADAGFGPEWSQKRQRKERDFLEKRAGNQKEKALKRWSKLRQNNHLADATGYAPTPTPTPTTPHSPPELELDGAENGLDLAAAFATWWSVYPRKVGKRKAEALWRRLVTKREVTIEALQEAVSAFAIASEGTEARYVPHPTTWLSGGRWADEEHSMSDTVEPLHERLKSKTIDQITEGLAFWRDNAHRHVGEEAYQLTLAAYEAEAQRRDLVVPP